jgi:hypothetical protein
MKTLSTTFSAAVLAAAIALLSACGGGSGNANGNNSTNNAAVNWPATPSWPASAVWPAAPSWPGNSGSGGSNSNSTPGNNMPVNPATAPANGPATIVPVSGANTATITVDGKTTINQPYVTITLCAPNAQGSNQCATIDRMILDTGSSGVRVAASALSSVFAAQLPAQTGTTDDPTGNTPVAECTTFASGFTWGSLKQATVSIGGETSSVMPVQIIGDTAFAVPADCSTHGGRNLSSASAMGGNGIVGISNLVYDYAAAANTAFPAAFYYCSSATSCTSTRLAVSKQPMNPVAAFPTDNNGSIIRLPGLSSSGAASATGQLIFGIGTQQNNAMPSTVNVLPLNQYGMFTSVYKGRSLTLSAIDSGTNTLLFPDSTIPTESGLYVPASPLGLTAIFQSPIGAGTQINVPFQIVNAENLYASGNAAFNNIGVNASGLVLWGLPFFYGRSVYTVLENAKVGSQAGPFVAF